jgi:hypothetical protein
MDRSVWKLNWSEFCSTSRWSPCQRLATGPTARSYHGPQGGSRCLPSGEGGLCAAVLDQRPIALIIRQHKHDRLQGSQCEPRHRKFHQRGWRVREVVWKQRLAHGKIRCLIPSRCRVKTPAEIRPWIAVIQVNAPAANICGRTHQAAVKQDDSIVTGLPRGKRHL